MYARRQTRPKPRKSQNRKWSAPVAGWVSNRALSDPQSIEGIGAAVLDNFYPRSTGVVLRRGRQLYATLEETDLPVTALFTYKAGTVEELFAANESTIYDLTSAVNPEDSTISDGAGNELSDGLGNVFGWASTTDLSVSTGYTGGDWSVIQFATTGGIYLVGVNGVDDGFIYDGTRFWPNVAGGVTALEFDTETADFTPGEILTGGTSLATATIWAVTDDGTTGTLYLTGVVGTFQDNETITDSDGGSALANGAPVLAMPGMDFGSLTSADMSFVWSYKNRLWFAENDSLNAWYLDVDSIAGTANIFPMGGVFNKGGSLLFGQRWSLESGGDGGLSEQNIFVSTEGEVAIYQGDSPDEAATWSIVGVYRIGEPLGKRAFMRGGGDLAIATTSGLVPLSKAISLDITALNVATVSYKIADAWTDAITLRGKEGWQALIWPQQKIAAVSPPKVQGAGDPVMFISNTETGAWARYTNWDALCMEVFRGEMYFGSPDGQVFKANAGGSDNGATYTGAIVPLFDDMGSAASIKVGTVGRARTRSSTPLVDRVDLLTDYSLNLPTAPDATPLTGTNTWGDAIWGSAQWSAALADYVGQAWRSIGGIGYAIAPCYQVTSGSVAPVDVELIDMETLYTTAEVVT